MNDFLKSKNVQCSKSKSFKSTDKKTCGKNAIFTLRPHKEPFVIKKG